MLIILFAILAIGLICVVNILMTRIQYPSPMPRPDFSNGVDAYLEKSEARFDNIRPDARKHVIWHGEKETKTDWVVVYLHGFSAAAPEIRPVPDRVAKELGANLYFGRLAGHGRGGDDMASASAQDWIRDTQEAMHIARALGDRILLISASTGGTLSIQAALDPIMGQNLSALVMVAPNLRIKAQSASLLTWPFSRFFIPLLAGSTRGWETPDNPAHQQAWTNRYPMVSLIPMAKLVKFVTAQNFSTATVPALVLYSPDDVTVCSDHMQELMSNWGGKVVLEPYTMGKGDDPNSHTIMGDIVSPGQTQKGIDDILNFVRDL